jgi:hypothetical protein
MPNELPRLNISVVWDIVCPGVVVWLGVLLMLFAKDGHSGRSMLKDWFRSR